MSTISSTEWSQASKCGRRCGIFGCLVKGTLRKCCLCEHHYCPLHLTFHEASAPHDLPVASEATNDEPLNCRCATHTERAAIIVWLRTHGVMQTILDDIKRGEHLK